ncbi:hypothetical protein [Rhodococcus ruber]|uniref:hypothetical protein n=1 Tax=Rhodococcus ruber TaxID=1830 RepID=UPI00167D7560|nr:hypothetical protein [Rhodococcus ruber]
MARTTMSRDQPRPRRKAPKKSLLAVALIATMIAAGEGIASAQPTTIPTPTSNNSTTAPPTTSSTEAPVEKQATPSTTEVTQAPTASTPSTTTVPAPPVGHRDAHLPRTEPTVLEMPRPETHHQRRVRRKPWVTWTPTENPNSTIVPGKMRSDRQELPEGFTKEDADKAEIAEAKLLAASRSRNARSSATNAVAAAAPTDCMVYYPAWQYVVCGAIRVKYDSLGG